MKNRNVNKIPVGIVLSGDMTRRGNSSEFRTGHTFLRKYYFLNTNARVGLNLGIDKPKVDFKNNPALFSIPGNHDIIGRKDPATLSSYISHFPYVYPVTWKIKTYSNTIYLHGINSTETSNLRQKLAKGWVKKDQLNKLLKRIDNINKQYNDSIHIVFLHHPIIDLPHKYTMRLDNYRYVSNSLKGYADIVLSGHIHEEKIVYETRNSPHQAIAGTATQICSTKNFLSIDIYSHEFIINIFKYDKKTDQFLVNSKPIKFPIGRRSAP